MSTTDRLHHGSATTTTVNAEGFANIFVDHVFGAHGLPKKIVSDRDARFTFDIS